MGYLVTWQFAMERCYFKSVNSPNIIILRGMGVNQQWQWDKRWAMTWPCHKFKNASVGFTLAHIICMISTSFVICFQVFLIMSTLHCHYKFRPFRQFHIISTYFHIIIIFNIVSSRSFPRQLSFSSGSIGITSSKPRRLEALRKRSFRQHGGGSGAQRRCRRLISWRIRKPIRNCATWQQFVTDDMITSFWLWDDWDANIINHPQHHHEWMGFQPSPQFFFKKNGFPQYEIVF